MGFRGRLTVMVVTFFAVIAADQGTKEWAVRNLQGAGRFSYLGDTLRIEYAENKGAFLGLAGSLSDGWRFALLTVLTGIILLAVLIQYFRQPNMHKVEIYGYALLFSGGIGNLVDRYWQGYVVDFLNMGIGGLRTGIFNVADMAIMAGIFGLIFLHFQNKKQTTEQEKAAAASASTASAPRAPTTAENPVRENHL